MSVWDGLRSVRARMTTLAVLLVAVALTLGAVALAQTLERSLTRSGDNLARSRAQDFAALLVTGNLPGTLTNVAEDSVAQVVAADGSVLAASPNITGAGPISSFTPDGDSPVVRTMGAVPDDDETEEYRVWALRQPMQGGAATVYVGTSLESVTEVMETLRESLMVGIPILVAMLGVAMWVLVGRTLRPVEGIRSEVAAISHQELNRRVPVPPQRDEVSRLATTMNDMLARLETASARQRDFV
ncbi:MAG: HAMP domain-containing protein, partial [Actinomycetes bacterium]